MSAHVFVDETKERGYLVAAAFVDPSQVTAARRAMAGLILPRQRRIHFNSERDERRHRAGIARADIAGIGRPRHENQRIQGHGDEAAPHAFPALVRTDRWRELAPAEAAPAAGMPPANPTAPGGLNFDIAYPDDRQETLSVSAIVDKYEQGTLDDEAFIWREGMTDWKAPFDIPEIASALEARVWPLIEAGKVRPQIFRTFPLAQAAEAHRLMESSAHIGKIVLVP